MSEIDSSSNEYNAVEPPHYKRGPIITRDIGEAITKGKSVFQFSIQCIEVMRHIKDPRLATAFKYLWRVAFGGKTDPNYIATQQEVEERDLKSAMWYLQDYLNHPPARAAVDIDEAYDVRHFGTEEPIATHRVTMAKSEEWME